MGYACRPIEIRHYGNVKCLIVYFIKGIVTENFLNIFSKFNSREKNLLESFKIEKCSRF